MKQLITRCDSIPSLISELREKYPTRIQDNEDGTVSFVVTKTNTLYNGLLSLSNVLVKNTLDEEMLRSLTSLEVLGTFDEIEADAVLDAKFKEVFDYTVLKDSVDEDGNAIQVAQSMRWCIHT